MPQFDENIYLNLLNTDSNGYITQIGLVHSDPRYRFDEKYFRRYLFDYVIKGQGFIEIGGETYDLEAGDLVFVAKGGVATYGADKSDPYEKIWFGASGVAVDALIDVYLGDAPIIIRKNSSIEPFLKMKSIVRASGYDEKQMMQVILELIMTLANIGFNENAAEERRELASKIRDYIDHRIAENLSLDEMAEYFHISKRHMIRIFKEKFGQTPGIYHTKARLAASTRYLCETEFTIGEIAAALGYCDQSSFAAGFKKHYGIYPTAYRKENRS